MECYNINNEFPMGDCFQSSGGINKIYFTNLSNIVSYAPVLESAQSDSLITGITMTAATYFYDFSPVIFEANYTQAAIENATGVAGYDVTLTIPFAKNEAETRNAIKMLRGRLTVIVKDVNGVYTLLGEEFGLRVAPSHDTGTAMADINRWTLVLKGQERTPAREVDPGIVSALLYVAP